MKGKKEIIIGITIVSAVVLLIFGIDFLKGINFFSSNRTFYSYYNNAQNLVPGSPIKVSGVQMGVVKNVMLSSNQQTIIAELNISNPDLKLPKNSKAMLGSDLLGTSIIDLIIGQDTLKDKEGNYKLNNAGNYMLTVSSKGLLEEGDTIEPDYKFGTMEMVTNKIEPIETRVNAVLTKVNGLIGGLEGAIGKEGEELRSIMRTLKNTLNTVNSSVQDVDDLVKTNTAYITKTIKNIESITGNLKESNEKVTNLIANFSDLSDTLKNTDITGTVKEAKNALAGVSDLMEEINNGDGSMHQLVYSDSLVDNVNSMIQEAESLVENIKAHPNRYLQFAVFGSKDKGVKLDSREEKKLKELLKE